MLQVVATKKNFYKPASPAWKAGGILPSRSSNGAAESSPELSLKPKASVLVVWGPYLVSPQSWVLNLIVAVIELWIELCIELWSQQCNWTWWLQLGIAKVGNTWVETTKKMGGRWVVGYAPGEVVKQSGWKSIHHEPKWVESSGRSDILNWMKKVDIVTSCNLFTNLSRSKSIIRRRDPLFFWWGAKRINLDFELAIPNWNLLSFIESNLLRAGLAWILFILLRVAVYKYSRLRYKLTNPTHIKFKVFVLTPIQKMTYQKLQWKIISFFIMRKFHWALNP